MSLFQKKGGAEAPRPKKAKAASAGSLKKRLAPPSTIRSRNGLFSTTLIAVAVVIVLVFNLAVSQLPESVRQFDLSSNKVYTISDTTKDYIAELSQPVKITVVATKDDADSRIVKFLNRYENLSDQITMEWIDPVAYPSALTDYDCEANTIVVSCEATGQTQQVSFSDILVSDDYYSYYYGSDYYTEFDGEGQLTSAIDYVISDASHLIYTTENHGESTLGDTLSDRLTKNHFSTSSLSLLQTGSVPEDCDLLIINAPTSDFSAEEVQLVENYLAAGGKVTLVWGTEIFDHPNLDSLMSTYGLQLTQNYVGDTSRYYAAAQSYYAFFPELDTSSDAAANVASDALVLLANSLGMTETTPARDTISVSSFLTTSEAGVTLDEDDNTTTGQYIVAATATETIETDTADADSADSSADASSSAADESAETSSVTASLTVCTASLIDEDIATQFGDSVANLTVFMNTVTSSFTDVSNISIEAKSLETPTNTVSNAGLWGLLFLAVLPIIVLALGAMRWWKRRKL